METITKRPALPVLTGQTRLVTGRVLSYLLGLGYPALGVLTVVYDLPVATYFVYAVIAGTALLAERMLPWIPVPEERRYRHRRTDFMYLLTAPAIMLLILQVIPPAMQFVRNWVFGTGVFWPTSLPTAVQVALALLGVEFAYYWAHKVSHHNPFLWKTHRVHHSPESLDWLMNWRVHWLNEVVHLTARFIPFVMLGVPAHVTALVIVIINAHAMFPHANIDVNSGRFLNSWLNTPEVHRWHHLQDLRFAHSNFGDVVLLWDRLFGTFNPPGVTRDRAIGLSSAQKRHVPDGFVEQVWRPFLRDRI